ncbi:MAG TPA: ergothioneine biosynthesis protein EgtB [Thermoanaerobaculia bacterium]|nr:ergothioneine biosynthesis protein EgtB [Thermoanaerobaculia bacterium]
MSNLTLSDSRAISGVDRSTLAARYREVRAQTERLCAPLVTEDYQVQACNETSPPKWHLAHSAWFFETFVLGPLAPGYSPYHPQFGHLFNSYYQAIGSFHARNQRHVVARPTVEEVYAYRRQVDECVLELLASAAEGPYEVVAERVVLGLHHEQQHQELLLMDIKRNFVANPLLPAYAPDAPRAVGRAPERSWLSFAEGVQEIGFAGDGFCFDNETPRHRVFLEPYRLASRLVTNGEYRAFVEADGYGQAGLWLSDGWKTVREQGWRSPLYWLEREGDWWEYTLRGLEPLDPDSPVCHLSYYEADAFARWAGARLPTEAELEVAGAGRPVEGSFVESGHFHPRPARDEEDGQWFGELWQWTASAYSAYPGFRPLPGALGEYNGKFMANQYVLRGGSCATPRSHMRPTYRNFFYPQDRWPFTGIRLATEG